MKIKHVIWDWNGTLLDDKELAITAINIILKRYDLPKITLEKYLKVFSFPVIDYYKRLGFDFEKTPFTQVGTEFIEEYTAHMYDYSLHDGARDTLKYLYNNGISQSLLSAAKLKMLDDLMAHHDIEKYFHRVAGLTDHYANSKLDAGKNLIDELQIDPSEILFVGDTEHDAEVANEIGANCSLIANGHAPFDKLEKTGKQVFHNILIFKEWFEKNELQNEKY